MFITLHPRGVLMTFAAGFALGVICGASLARAEEPYPSTCIQTSIQAGEYICPGGTGPMLCNKNGCKKCGIYVDCPSVAILIERLWQLEQPSPQRQ